MTDWPVRLVFDTSAILEYCRGSLAVGELLGEFLDDRTAVALPVACLAQAYPVAVESGLLSMLVEHDATVLVEGGDDWEALGVLCAATGGYDTASAALAAVDGDCWVLTVRPDLYEQVAGGGLTIAVDG